MFVKITNGQVDQYPYTMGELRKANPNISFPRSIPPGILSGFGVYPVQAEPIPEYNIRTHKLVENQPALINGVWTLTYSTVAKSQEEIDQETKEKETEIRTKRNKQLTNSDWTQGKDIADEVSSAWATYRQSLRDITTQEGFPWEVVWPEKPV